MFHKQNFFQQFFFITFFHQVPRILLIIGVIGLLCTSVLLTSSPKKLDRLQTKTLTLGSIEITVEIAKTEKERARGLMHRDSLRASEGMLFLFPQETILSFWMKNTRIDLSLGFFNKEGCLEEVHEMKKNQTTEIYSSQKPYRIALEMRKNFFMEKFPDWFKKKSPVCFDKLEFKNHILSLIAK